MRKENSHGRKLREHRHSKPGQVYCLTTSVVGRRRIFASTPHAEVVLDAIRWLHSSLQFAVEAAVVMPDHLHMVGELGDCTLTKVMHSLKSCTGHSLAAAGVEVPVWQPGYYDHRLRSDEDYRLQVRYVLENPLRAGLTSRVEDYPHLILPDWWDGSLG